MIDFSSEYERIEHNLTLHTPDRDAVIDAMDALRGEAKAFSHLIDALVPASREKSMALTDVELALASAIAGVARNQDQYPGGSAVVPGSS